jgi:hypothetical protein
MGPAPEERTGAGAALPDRAGGDRRRVQQGHRCNANALASGGDASSSVTSTGCTTRGAPGEPRSIADEEIERVIVTTLRQFLNLADASVPGGTSRATSCSITPPPARPRRFSAG